MTTPYPTTSRAASPDSSRPVEGAWAVSEPELAPMGAPAPRPATSALISANPAKLDADALEAIDAALFLEVYEARRRARLRYLGTLPPPPPNPRALELRRRAGAVPAAWASDDRGSAA